MKTYNERTASIREKAREKKASNRRRNALIVSVSGCLALVMIVSAVLFTPYDWFNKNEEDPYADNEYAPLIRSLRPLTATATPTYKNFFDKLMSGFVPGGTDSDIIIGAPNGSPGGDIILEDGYLGMPEVDAMVPEAAPSPSTDSGNSYEEITDNQVQGVTEADLIKRSNKHIFYLRGDTLTAYTIAQEASTAVGSYQLTGDEQITYRYYDNLEMYLSLDCSTITIVTNCYMLDTDTACIALINLDVTDPTDIQLAGSCYFTGSYLSSRVVDGELYLMSHYYVDSQPDFDDVSTFLPQHGTPENMSPVTMDEIFIPEEPTSAMYTVVYRIDSATLDVTSSAALLSYAGQVYMSKENIFLTRGYTEESEADSLTIHRSMTEITQLNYNLDTVNTYNVAGSVSNQYYLDECDDILRIVTTTSGSILRDYGDSETYVYYEPMDSNASLYCIDLHTGKLRASVENFAPAGESVQSVRFDGTKAYVCTSIVLTDPVFFFELSDLDNITYKDTGTIPGYSISLVDFADDFLMGIGYGNSFGTLKIEIYREGENSVESYCKYERENCYFSSEYKSYYIDRENKLIGIGITDYGYEDYSRYILLFFDGYDLRAVSDEELPGLNDYKRAVYIDGYLYMFADDFLVKQIG